MVVISSQAVGSRQIGSALRPTPWLLPNGYRLFVRRSGTFFR